MLGQVVFWRTQSMQVGVETSSKLSGAVSNKFYGDVSRSVYAPFGTWCVGVPGRPIS